MDDKARARINKIFYEKYLPAYQAFMLAYPFALEDLPNETWKWIKDFEGRNQISNYGRVKTFNKKGVFIRKPSLDKNGYLMIKLNLNCKYKYYSIHRLVAEYFIPNPENKPEVNHLDGVKFNCHESNLEWSTHSENIQHALKIGLQKIGAERHNSKLTEEQVREIRRIYKKDDREFGACALGRKFNVGYKSIEGVVKGKYYKNVK